MATIQIRDIPEESYEIIRRRSRATGRSIQSYMREVTIDHARRPTAEEILDTMARIRAESDLPGPTAESILAALDAERR